MITAWAYIRVSGDDQADRGLPVAGQRDALERYAQEHGLHLARVFVDEAKSGGTDQRAEFQRMMYEAHRTPPPCETILLWSWSRFSRDQTDAHYWKASLRRHGVHIADVSGEVPAIEGFEYVLESLIHWRDEQKRVEVARDARRGQQTLARMGYVPSGAEPPRGYRVVTERRSIEGRDRELRRWAPDPDAWPLVQHAWELRLRGASYRRIIEETGLYKTPGCLSTFFRNTIYKGELWFGGTLIEVEPVVTEEEWQRVNANRAKRRGGAYPRQQGSRFLLSGLLRCERCGSALAGDHSSGGVRNDGYQRAQWDHYVCVNAKARRCDLPRLGAQALERAVIDALLTDVLTVESLERQMEQIAAARDESAPLLTARRDALRQELAEAELGVERLLDAIERAADSSALTTRLRQREAQRAALIAQIGELDAQIDADLTMPDVDAIRAALATALDSADPAVARSLLRELVQAVVVDVETMRVQYHYPFGPTRIR